MSADRPRDEDDGHVYSARTPSPPKDDTDCVKEDKSTSVKRRASDCGPDVKRCRTDSVDGPAPQSYETTIHSFNTVNDRSLFIERLRSRCHNLPFVVYLFKPFAVELLLRAECNIDPTTFDTERLANDLQLSKDIQVSVNKMALERRLELSAHWISPGDRIARKDNDGIHYSTVGAVLMCKVPGNDRRTRCFALSAGHGKKQGDKIYGALARGTNTMGDIDYNRFLGHVRHVWEETKPTCDAALICMGSGVYQSNSVSNFQNRTVKLDGSYRDPDFEDVVYKFCNGSGGIAASQPKGRVEYLHYYNVDEPIIEECIAFVNDEDERVPFSERGDSGMLVAAVSCQQDGTMLATGLAVIIAIDNLILVDGSSRYLTIAQPLRRVMEKIQEELLYDNIHIAGAIGFDRILAAGTALDVTDSALEVAVSAPDASYSASDVTDSTGNAADSALDATDSALEVADSAPDVGDSAPDATDFSDSDSRQVNYPSQLRIVCNR